MLWSAADTFRRAGLVVSPAVHLFRHIVPPQWWTRGMPLPPIPYDDPCSLWCICNCSESAIHWAITQRPERLTVRGVDLGGEYFDDPGVLPGKVVLKARDTVPLLLAAARSLGIAVDWPGALLG
jgi:hypothetical protein